MLLAIGQRLGKKLGMVSRLEYQPYSHYDGAHTFLGAHELLGLLTFWAHMGAHEGSRGAHTKSIFLSCRATNHKHD